MSKIDELKLEELLDSDQKICETAQKNAKQNALTVSENYKKLLKKMQDEFKKLGEASDYVMFGNGGNFEVIRKEIGPTKIVHRNSYEWDHNEPIGDIS